MVGSGLGVVVATGIKTEIGKISTRIADIDTEIPLKTEIRSLSKYIIYVTGLIASMLFIVGLLKDKPPIEMFATVISLTVSVIPEGLPVVMTLVLATGVWKMSKRNALVKKLQAVEALGQATILALDKTGTITLGNRMATEFIPAAGVEARVVGAAGVEAWVASAAAGEAEERAEAAAGKHSTVKRAEQTAALLQIIGWDDRSPLTNSASGAL